ncbi:MAG: 50S ribosomal protein L9 [Verrucomicrobiales bacterium]|nr:50S ribosomal protein L9 [Verrucomicrobiales bacterium]
MATVDIILREKVDGLGAEADVVSVKRGFARNCLLPQGKAYEATKGNLRHIEHLQAVRAQREADELADADKLATKLKKMKLTLELSIGESGKAFGSITTSDIVEAINAKSRQINLDRHQLQLDKPIKSTGSFDIPVKLHADVPAQVTVKVVAETKEEDDAEDAGDE